MDAYVKYFNISIFSTILFFTNIAPFWDYKDQIFWIFPFSTYQMNRKCIAKSNDVTMNIIATKIDYIRLNICPYFLCKNTVSWCHEQFSAFQTQFVLQQVTIFTTPGKERPRVRFHYFIWHCLSKQRVTFCKAQYPEHFFFHQFFFQFWYIQDQNVWLLVPFIPYLKKIEKSNNNLD